MKEFFKRKWVKWSLIGLGGVVVVGTGIQGYFYWQTGNPNLLHTYSQINKKCDLKNITTINDILVAACGK